MTSSLPTAPDSKLGHAFYDAVAAGEDGRAEYVAWRDAWKAYIEALDAHNFAIQQAHDAAKRRFDHLVQEARRLNALDDRVGRQVASVDGSFTYTAARHELAKAQWRADLATYKGKPVPEDTPIDANAVPFVPYPSTVFVDRTAGPRDYSDELNAALNATTR